MRKMHPNAASRGLEDYFTEKVEFTDTDGQKRYFYRTIVNAYSPEAFIALINYVFNDKDNLQLHAFEKLQTKHIEKINYLEECLNYPQFRDKQILAERAKSILQNLAFEPYTNSIQIYPMKFYNDDPEKGGKEISIWEHLERSGSVQRLKEKGFPIFPSHDSKLRKAHKQEAFEKALNAFTNDRAIKKLQTTEEDRKAFRVMWLNNEIQITEKVIAASDSNSDKLELSKYLYFVQTEREELINQPKFERAENKTTLREQALLLYYKGVRVTRINADKHLPEGFISASKLFKHYDEFSEPNARTGSCLSSREFRSLKRVFESVIKELEGDAMRTAEKELLLLKQNNKHW